MKSTSCWFSLFYFCLFITLGTKVESKSQDPIKLYCMYTQQFKTLYEEFFLPSLKDDFELMVNEFVQECPTGIYRSEGWDKTMLKKLEMLTHAIEENWNQVFIYSDIDIIFLEQVVDTCLRHLGNKDFVVQQGWPRNGLCAGFFVMKGNEKTLKLIKTAHTLLQRKICIDDQVAIQTALNYFKDGEIAWAFLPSEQFPNGRRVLKSEHGLYSENSEIEIDEGILLFHANCCIGLDNKYHFLKRVQEEHIRKKSLKKLKEIATDAAL